MNSMRVVEVKGKKIGDGFPTYIVAEIGGNFKTFEEGKKLIKAAVKTGVDAIKIQTFRADRLTVKSARYEMENTGSITQWELFKKYELSEETHRKLFEFMANKNIVFFSTPSHETDVDFLEQFNPPVYKIGSDDCINIPLIHYIAQLGKPIIMSLGMCTMLEVEEAVSAVLEEGNDSLILMHCVTEYPAKCEHSNLKAIQTLKNKFSLPVGFSDHSLGYDMSYASVAVGANIVERHFTYNKNADGPDHMLSSDEEELKTLVRKIRILEQALGDGIKVPSRGEEINRINNRKSIVSVRPIPKGTIITKDMIAIKRPGFGIQPKYIEEVIGKIAKEDILSEMPILWQQI